jgi:hypothetical protein
MHQHAEAPFCVTETPGSFLTGKPFEEISPEGLVLSMCRIGRLQKNTGIIC